MTTMKTTLATIILAVFAMTLAALGQDGLANAPAKTPQSLPQVFREHPGLTRFNLEFPGGNPRDLVNAIEAATDKPLNVIMREEDTEVSIPPFTLKSVTVADLFAALKNVGQSSERTVIGTDDEGKPVYGTQSAFFAFRTEGKPDDNAVWSFVAHRRESPPEAKLCRFYNLAPYLNSLKIDDITTAVRTGWEMLGESNTPKLSFHSDTKLLIAVGRPDQLKLIDSVLQELAQTVQWTTDSSAKLQKELEQVRAKFLEASTRFTPNHPTMVSLRVQKEELEARLRDSIQRP